MKKLILFVSFVFITSLCFGQNAWINELHYDNDGGDVGEFVEVVIENPGSYSLIDFTVSLYNGSSSSGAVYGSETLDNCTVGNTSGNYTFYTWPHAGIQNGAPDGLSLDYQGTLISGQFLSYEGTFTATDGPAIGVLSTDIGVFEPGTTPIGESLQLSGTGTGYTGFTWQDPAAETPGALNNSQTFGSGPAPLAISNVARQYTVPTAAQTCYVSCDITGGTSPYTALIKYSVDGVAQSDISMGDVGGDSYSGTIPAQSDGARVEYYIDVTDDAKANVTSSTYGLFWGTSPISNASGDIREVDGSGVLAYDGYYARITGVATVASGIYSTSNLDVYLQDSFGGINLFKYGIVSITAGNSYTAFGVIDQYNGKAEIVPDDASTDITDNGAGTMPSPAIITIAQFLSNPEYYEGMLIGIQHVSNTGLGDPWPASGSNADVEITDDGGTSKMILRVDKDTDLDENTEPTWPKDVVGIASQYDYSSPYDSGYQIIPRAFSDIWDDGTLPVELSSFTAEYTINQAGQGYVSVNWATASETDVIGFNIYRSLEDNLAEAEQVNFSLISGHGTTTQPNEYSFTDESADAIYTTYYYWLESVNYGGTTDIYGSIQYDPVDVDGDGLLNTVIHSFLNDVFPNPVQVGENITFKFMIGGLEGTMRSVSLNIYNIKGELVKEVINEDMMVDDDYTETWRVNDMANGVYFYQLKTENYQETKKLLIQ